MRNMLCGEIKEKHVNKLVYLCGWINNVRNFGNFMFADIRDYTGIVQIFFNFKLNNNLLKAKKLRNEFCVQIYGTIKLRNKKNVNIHLPTGTIEVVAISLLIFNTSKSLPLDIYKNNKEEIRLRYRYLDLRRPKMFNIFKLRSKVLNWFHNFMYINKFMNVETPFLTKSTPEGARDYIVPSRNHPKKFYALPQSPQLFKQLLMIAGFDKYYQITRCFRDEDLRSNRQPEFTQLDVEMSFVTSIQIRKFMENMISQLWLKIKQVKLNSFPTIDYHECINAYGTDKPDLRNPLKLVDIKDMLNRFTCNFIYDKYDTKNSRIVTFAIPENLILDHQKITFYLATLKKYGVEKLFYFYINNGKTHFVENKNFLKKMWNLGFLKKIITELKIKKNSIIFIMGNLTEIINSSFNALRTQINTDLNFINNNKSWKPLWIVNFPLFSLNNEKKIVSTHHPFTAPHDTNITKLNKNPTKVLSDSYDLIINGYEIGGGSTRIHHYKLQKEIFKILGLTTEIQEKNFGFFITALKFGTPPHAGIAFGLDRIIMLLSNTRDIKDVIAFPKTSEAQCFTTNAPTKVSRNTLKSLFIKTL